MTLMIVLIHNNELERLVYARSVVSKLLKLLPVSQYVEIESSGKDLRMKCVDYVHLLQSRFSMTIFRLNWYRKGNFNSETGKVLKSFRFLLSFFVICLNIAKLELLKKNSNPIRDLNLRHTKAHDLFLNSDAKNLLILESDFVLVDLERFITLVRNVTQSNNFDLVNLCDHFTVDEMGLSRINNDSHFIQVEGIRCREHHVPYVNTSCALLFSRMVCSELSRVRRSKLLEFWSVDWLYNRQLGKIKMQQKVLDICEPLVINGSLKGFYASTIQHEA